MPGYELGEPRDFRGSPRYNPIDMTESADNTERASLRWRISDDAAYLLPYFAFLLVTWAAGQWPAAYPVLYVVKAVAAAALLIWLWPRFTRIRWDYWWIGLIAGVIGIFQWVLMQLWLQDLHPFFSPSGEAFNPLQSIQPAWLCWTWIAVRLASASLVVPIMEELFWRDYLWRRIVAPNNFKLATIGEWDWKAFVMVSLAFAVVHGNWWLTSIVWGFMVGAVLLYTRSLGACIVMHATTNLLLGLWVLQYGKWEFW